MNDNDKEKIINLYFKFITSMIEQIAKVVNSKEKTCNIKYDKHLGNVYLQTVYKQLDCIILSVNSTDFLYLNEPNPQIILNIFTERYSKSIYDVNDELRTLFINLGFNPNYNRSDCKYSTNKLLEIFKDDVDVAVELF
jgi:hypothetical protein